MNAISTCPACGRGLAPGSIGGACPSCEHPTQADGRTLTSGRTEAATIATANPGLTPVVDSTREVGGTTDPFETRADPHGPANWLPEPEASKVYYFGNYELLSEIARGGMGVVYRARQVGLKRVVALKMILSAQFASQDEVKRFRVEAEAAAGLDHSNIVPIYEVGEHEDRHYYTMKLVEGRSLARRAADGPIAAREAVEIVATIARAVHHAHRRGILHRDLKPANVLLDEQGQPHVTDFGLAKQIEGDSQLTKTGAVMGSPSYMSPEQASGRTRALTVAADVYSLGAILYDLLAGEPPFHGNSVAETLWQVLHDEPRRPRSLRPSISPDLETIALKCLEKDPARRYESADDLASELDRWLVGEPIKARRTTATERALKWARRRPAIAALCATILVVGVAGLSGILWQWRASVANAEKADDLAFVANVEARRARVGEQDAIRARREARGQLIDFSVASGLAAARRRDHDQAMLYFANAIQHAGSDPDPDRDRLNRIRLRNWSRSVVEPIRNRAVAGFRALEDRFLAFEFHPSGRFLLALSSTGLNPIWDLEADNDFPLPGPPRPLSAAAWSPDGRRLALGTPEGRVEILEFPSCKLFDAWDAEAGEVLALAFTADGRHLATGARAGARVRDLEAKTFVTPPLPHPAGVVLLVFDDPGERLCTVALDSQVRVYATSAATTAPMFDPVHHSMGNFGVSHGGADAVAPRFVDGGRVLLTVMKKNPNFDLVWRRADTGAVIETHSCPNDEDLTALSVSPDGSLALALWTNTGRIYRTKDRSLYAIIPHIELWTEQAVFSPKGDMIATGGHDTLVRLWSTQQNDDLSVRPERHPIRHPSMVARVRFSADGSRLAVGQRDGSIRIWRTPPTPTEDYRIPVKAPTRVALSPDGTHALACGVSFRECQLVETTVLDAATGLPAGPVLRPGGVIVDASFSQDGRHVATASSAADTPSGRRKVLFEPDGRAGNVQIWDWSKGTRVVGPIALPTEPRGLEYSPDGRRLAVTCGDGWVVLLDPTTGALIRTFDTKVHTRKGNANLWQANGAARFNPTGNRLITWELPTTVHVWDADTGAKVADLPHADRVETVDFSADPNVMLTCGRDFQVRVWDLTTGRLAAPSLEHPRFITNAAFNPRGDQVQSCGDDGIFRTWDWRRGESLSAFRVSETPVISFALTADHRWLVTTGMGQTNVADALTGTPITPPLFGPPAVNLRVSITRDNHRAIVSGFSGEIVGYDLDSLLAPSETSDENLLRHAEVVACQRVNENRELVQLSADEWLQRWNAMQTHP